MPRQALHSRLALASGKVLEWLASGMSTEEILANYENLEGEDILAALAFAARLVNVKRLERLAA